MRCAESTQSLAELRWGMVLSLYYQRSIESGRPLLRHWMGDIGPGKEMSIVYKLLNCGQNERRGRIIGFDTS